MRKRGEISVFLALVLLSVWALLCGMVESARTVGARLYLRQAFNSSADSLLSQYHRQLWQRYRILGLEYENERQLEEEMSGFLAPYLEAKNWYPQKLESVKIKELEGLADADGRYLEEQILAYMKYGIAQTDLSEISEADVGEVFETLTQAGAVQEMESLYEGHAREALKLEKSLEKLRKTVDEQEAAWEKAREELKDADGDGFDRAAKAQIRSLEKIPGRVEDYQKRADRLQTALDESRAKFDVKREELGSEVFRALEEEIAQYETYTKADGERRAEIEGLVAISEAAIRQIQAVQEEADEVQDYIDNWDSDEEEELDEEECWEPVLRSWERVKRPALSVAGGVADAEKEGFLEAVRELATKGLLKAVLPENAPISSGKPDLTNAPSTQYKKKGSSSASLFERLILGEYTLRYLDYYGREPGLSGGCAYETEYLLFGKKTDEKNLEAMAVRLLAVREGLNLAHILSDPAKRSEARTLAGAIAGGVGLSPLTGVVAFFIMGIWALGEAILDVRALLSGEKVVLLKTKTTWKLTLEELLRMGQTKGASIASHDAAGENGLTYRGYLRLFLMAGWSSQTDYRLLDVMQGNIREKQSDFRIRSCAYRVQMRAQFLGKHLFLFPSRWIRAGQGNGSGYEMELSVSGNY